VRFTFFASRTAGHQGLPKCWVVGLYDVTSSQSENTAPEEAFHGCRCAHSDGGACCLAPQLQVEDASGNPAVLNLAFVEME
jgi:hypothetical protein